MRFYLNVFKERDLTCSFFDAAAIVFIGHGNRILKTKTLTQQRQGFHGKKVQLLNPGFAVRRSNC